MGSGLPSLERIDRDAQELRKLWSRIGETARHRRLHPEGWQQALAEFGRHFEATGFPGGFRNYDRFLAGEPNTLEPALRFIEADPRFFRSGYMKEALWRKLARIELDDVARCRLEQAALHRLDGSPSREFWYLCRAMVRIARPDFQELVRAKAETSGEELSLAHCLLAHFEGPHAVDAIRRRVRDSRHSRSSPRRPDVRFDR
jgi:hypothetical protein